MSKYDQLVNGSNEKRKIPIVSVTSHSDINTKNHLVCQAKTLISVIKEARNELSHSTSEIRQKLIIQGTKFYCIHLLSISC